MPTDGANIIIILLIQQECYFFFDVLFLILLLLATFCVLFAISRWLFYCLVMFGLVYRWGSSMLTRPTPYSFQKPRAYYCLANV